MGQPIGCPPVVAIRRGIMAKEEAELAGRKPGRVSSTVARVPELIGFHIGR